MLSIFGLIKAISFYDRYVSIDALTLKLSKKLNITNERHG